MKKRVYKDKEERLSNFGGNISHYFTSETAREAQKLGAMKRKENTAKRKALKQSLDLLLTKSMRRGKMADAEDIKNIADAEGMNISAQEAMAVAMIQRATMGDVSAFLAIRDTVGEKPSDKVELDASKTIEEYAKNHKIKV